MKEYNIVCEKCEKKFKSKRKIRFCSNSCRASVINKGRKPSNYIEGKIRNCLTCGKKLHHQTKTGFCKEHYRTDEYKKNMSKTLVGKTGGYRKNGGVGKSGWYKGYWCDSSYELVFVIYNLEHNVEFSRNKKGFEYIYENKTYKYYPDFVLNDTFIEIKGWLDKKNEEKINQFKGNLKVLFKKDLKKEFEYVINKYGVDFIKLYEENTKGM